jgi:tRNA modification GTPase
MIQNLYEPICALITPSGHAAINVLRISGPGSVAIVAENFRPRARLLRAKSHTVLHGIFHDRAGIPIDEVLCTVFRAPTSYTGEESVELSCHGNPLIARRILEALLINTRLAEPGEFTLRAMLNGKLDLASAEAINDLIQASTSRASSSALTQAQGVLSRHLQGIMDRITDARLRCEMAIDFADQDLPQIDIDDLKQRVKTLLRDTRQLREEGTHGRYIREGIRVCLAGAPNSGKSSLFNAFLKNNRAIVTPHPGTTRDYLEESISLKGYQVIFYDTAGLRQTDNSIESEGIARSHELMRTADLVLYLVDASLFQDAHFVIDSLPAELHSSMLIVLSKSDLLDDAHQKQARATIQTQYPLLPVTLASVMEDDGLRALTDNILARFALPDVLPDRPLVTNARHLAALDRCTDALQSAVLAISDGAGFEFIAFDLIAASNALGEILGILTPDDLLQSIFSNFCVGK